MCVFAAVIPNSYIYRYILPLLLPKTFITFYPLLTEVTIQQYFIRPFKEGAASLSSLQSFLQELVWLFNQREAQQTLGLVAVNLLATLLLLSWCHATRSMGELFSCYLFCCLRISENNGCFFILSLTYASSWCILTYTYRKKDRERGNTPKTQAF